MCTLCSLIYRCNIYTDIAIVFVMVGALLWPSHCRLLQSHTHARSLQSVESVVM